MLLELDDRKHTRHRSNKLTQKVNAKARPLAHSVVARLYASRLDAHPNGALITLGIGAGAGCPLERRD